MTQHRYLKTVFNLIDTVYQRIKESLTVVLRVRSTGILA